MRHRGQSIWIASHDATMSWRMPVDAPPRAVFRTDASSSIGGGHVMRCLTLACCFSEAGWSVGFACAAETLITVPSLRVFADILEASMIDPDDMARRWPLGCEILVVDHYGLDAGFEAACRPWARRILVIDDLADRPHDCDLLIDYTLGRVRDHYRHHVPSGCRLLTGPDYALLRPQFARRRVSRRRAPGEPWRVLVTMGLSDVVDATSMALSGLVASGVPVTVDIVMGSGAAHLVSVRARARAMGAGARVFVDVEDMASLMADADLAIGAAGTTSWERCCMGLPTLMVILADNQTTVAHYLVEAEAAILLGRREEVTERAVADTIKELWRNASALRDMSRKAAAICDGFGAARVMDVLRASTNATTQHLDR